MYDAGFVGLTWPKESGGRGLTFMEEMILQEEMALAKAPPVLNILAVGMAGPTINAYGTEEQKKRYPPKMLSCEEIWCQGYSEPNSGSDLASLQTRAVKDGEHYVINGQKVWTSLAHIADWMMLLARTDPAAPKHKGITYFLLDMHAPGVTVKPLKQITGDAEFNEVYFDNVRIHESQILGRAQQRLGGGPHHPHVRAARPRASGCRCGCASRWTASSTSRAARGRTACRRPRTPSCARSSPRCGSTPRCSSTRAPAPSPSSSRASCPGPEASTGKMMWVEGHQRLQELAMELEGPYAQLTKGSRWAVENGLWQYGFLRSRANSIEGGTTEIQKNIIGERVLGLPKG